jgi:hypothetical protein
VRHVACTWGKANTCRVLVEKPEGRDSLENTSVDGKKILQWILKQQNGCVCVFDSCLKIRTRGKNL